MPSHSQAPLEPGYTVWGLTAPRVVCVPSHSQAPLEPGYTVWGLTAPCVVCLPSHSQAPLEPGYTVWGLTAAEVELDVLTGEYRFNRVDVYEDAGQSLSPWIDVGQVEGAFTMGMGLFLTEQYRYDPDTGRKLTNRAWVRSNDAVTKLLYTSLHQTIRHPTSNNTPPCLKQNPILSQTTPLLTSNFVSKRRFSIGQMYVQ